MVKYINVKEKSLKGRYITNSEIELLHIKHKSLFSIKKIGSSVKGKSIYGYKLGAGKKRILVWSQMHGNESTTTKALHDFFNRMHIDDDEYNLLMLNCTFFIIPILNPDGALNYKRVNANNIDLNRDAQLQSQPESKVLMEAYFSFNPDYCFNLHGQRTIFSAGYSSNSSILSFLSPAQDLQSSITKTRKLSMEVIVAIKNSLETKLEGFISRYNDDFNINCVGDTFQVLNTPTILFEAGHYPNDYHREKTRYYIYESLMASFKYIANLNKSKNDYKQYFDLPENRKLFYDIIIRDTIFSDGEVIDVAIQYDEVLDFNKIIFQPKIVKIGDLSEYFGHKEIAGCKNPILINNSSIRPNILTIIDKITINGIDFAENITV